MSTPENRATGPRDDITLDDAHRESVTPGQTSPGGSPAETGRQSVPDLLHPTLAPPQDEAPRAFNETIRNLKEIAPTCYLNVPKGFEMLVHELDRDEQLAKNFFSRVKFLKYAGASLPQHVWDGLERVAPARWGP